MDDQQIVGLLDPDDLQRNTAIILADPQQPLVKVALGRESLRLPALFIAAMMCALRCAAYARTV